MNNDIRELLERKAEEMQLGPGIPSRVLRRSRGRRAVNAALVSAMAAGVAAGAFLGARAALDDNVTPPPNSVTNPTSSHEAWFTRDHHLFVSSVNTTDEPQAVLQALLRGPTGQEAAAGVSSSIDAGTELQNLSIQGGIARVRLSTHAESDPLSDAQVVYTLTQFPNVERVMINDQEGGPLTQDDLADQLPAILVESPHIGDTVSSPITIAGTANVFEAHVQIWILDAAGNKIVNTYTTATCGTGCRGDYTTQVPYSLAGDTQLGTVVLFEPSGKDGSPTNVVRIPVTLEPNEMISGEVGPPAPAPFDGIWPAADETQLRQLQKQAMAGQADYALDPDTAAVQFATDILQWPKSSIQVNGVGNVLGQSSDNVMVSLWSTDMGSAYSKDIALDVFLQQMGQGDPKVWVVTHVVSGMFDLTCPSIRQDVIVTTSPVEICGTFTQPAPGWIVKATLEYAGSDLQGSEAQSSADVPVTDRGFQGRIPLNATYAGEDVTLQVRMYSGSGATLGLWTRRFQTELPPEAAAPPPALTPAAARTREAIVAAAIQQDYSALSSLTGREFEYGFIVSGYRPPAYFAGLERSGELGKMLNVLRSPYTARHTAHGLLFVWPSAFDIDLTKPLTAAEQSTVDRLLRKTGYTRQALRQWMQLGYTGVRVGIRADGTWAFLVAGRE